jgi:hypothetical protein
MPIGSVDAIGLRLTAGGTPILDTFVQEATDSGLFWKATVIDGGGGAPTWEFIAAPSCADVDDIFGTCEGLADAVGSCAELEVYGYG